MNLCYTFTDIYRTSHAPAATNLLISLLATTLLPPSSATELSAFESVGPKLGIGVILAMILGSTTGIRRKLGGLAMA